MRYPACRNEPWCSGALQGDLGLDIFLQCRSHCPALSLDILNRSLNSTVAIRVAQPRVVNSCAEPSSAVPGNLLCNVDYSRLLILLGDDAIILEPNRLKILAYSMDHPFFRRSLPIHRVAPHATAFGLLHHQNCLCLTIRLIRLLLVLIAFLSLVTTNLIFSQKSIIQPGPGQQILRKSPWQPQAL